MCKIFDPANWIKSAYCVCHSSSYIDNATQSSTTMANRPKLSPINSFHQITQHLIVKTCPHNPTKRGGKTGVNHLSPVFEGSAKSRTAVLWAWVSSALFHIPCGASASHRSHKSHEASSRQDFEICHSTLESTGTGTHAVFSTVCSRDGYIPQAFSDSAATRLRTSLPSDRALKMMQK